MSAAPRLALACLAACTALLFVPPLAGADPNSLYQGPGPRPGPDILYEPLADAPQLQNAGNWNASPILVSGSTAYRGGEFLYQDWIYDDSGALGNPATNDPRTDSNSFSRSSGTYLYPTDTAIVRQQRRRPRRAACRAAGDIDRLPYHAQHDQGLERRSARRSRSAEHRGSLHDWPYSANVRSPAQYFLTVHGTTTAGEVVADLRDAVTGPAGRDGAHCDPRHDASADHVTVPHSSWNPGTGVWRLAAGVGLWNASTNALPGADRGNPTATQPGGAQLLGSPPALFNLAFRDECQQEDPVPPRHGSRRLRADAERAEPECARHAVLVA